MNTDAKTLSRKWFQEARFGMFVHWGLYAITGRDMWYYSTEEVDREYYERLFHRFNPVDYNPAEWARIARQAGMKYAVFITKHHDGFCLWDSKYTDFNVTGTPYGKDLLGPWLDAYRAEGLKVGVYYSLLDWHHPDFTVDYLHPQRARAEELNRTRDFSKYVGYLHNQVHVAFTQRDRNLYLHCFDEYPPYDIIMKNLGGKADYVEFVGDKTEIQFENVMIDGGSHIKLHLPIISPDPYDTVIRIMLK